MELFGRNRSTGADGTFQLTLDPKQSYIFTAKAEGYITLDEQLAFTSGKAYRLMRKPIASVSQKPVSSCNTTAAPVVKPTPVAAPLAASQAASQSSATSVASD